jgi:hypothetical protein
VKQEEGDGDKGLGSPPWSNWIPCSVSYAVCIAPQWARVGSGGPRKITQWGQFKWAGALLV